MGVGAVELKRGLILLEANCSLTFATSVFGIFVKDGHRSRLQGGSTSLAKGVGL